MKKWIHKKRRRHCGYSMRYVDEFRDIKLVRAVAGKIRALAGKDQLRLMEVCGTHTQNFLRFGLDKLLPKNISLISGPGCPVCVSAQGYIDAAIHLAGRKDVLVLTFADMLRVPGSASTLEKERACGGDVRVVYSPLDALRMAKSHPEKKVVFLAVGFETTAPTIALSVLSAKKQKINNLFFFCALKLIPPAMDLLVEDKRLKIDGFLCPGHVSAIIGLKPYQTLAHKHGLCCCVAGFEPLDILEGIYMLLDQIRKRKAGVTNQYIRAVNKNGNLQGKNLMRRVFKISDAAWRGFGTISKSGLELRDAYGCFDAGKEFGIRRLIHDGRQAPQCKCAQVLKGLFSPAQCPLFGRACLPEHPVGPCMVSYEGACNAHYKYRR